MNNRPPNSADLKGPEPKDGQDSDRELPKLTPVSLDQIQTLLMKSSPPRQPAAAPETEQMATSETITERSPEQLALDIQSWQSGLRQFMGENYQLCELISKKSETRSFSYTLTITRTKVTYTQDNKGKKGRIVFDFHTNQFLINNKMPKDPYYFYQFMKRIEMARSDIQNELVDVFLTDADKEGL